MFNVVSCKLIDEHQKNSFETIFPDTFIQLWIQLPEDWSLEFVLQDKAITPNEIWEIKIPQKESTIFIMAFKYSDIQNLERQKESHEERLIRAKDNGVIGSEFFKKADIMICNEKYTYYEYDRWEGELSLGRRVRAININFYSNLISYNVQFYIYEEDWDCYDRMKDEFLQFISNIECE
jgi:hypothetical protein